MTATELLNEAAAAGLHIELMADGGLMVRPRARCTPAIIERLRAAKADLIAYLRRQRMAEQAADKLGRHPHLQRAVHVEPDGDGRCLVAVAVRMVNGIATAILTVPAAEPSAFVAALDRACAGRLQ